MRERLHPDDLAALVDAAAAAGRPMNIVSKWVLGITASILTLVLWSQNTKLDTQTTEIALLKHDVLGLGQIIDSKMGDRFTATDAKSMSSLYDLRFNSVMRDLETLEARLASLEAKR